MGGCGCGCGFVGGLGGEGGGVEVGAGGGEGLDGKLVVVAEFECSVKSAWRGVGSSVGPGTTYGEVDGYEYEGREGREQEASGDFRGSWVLTFEVGRVLRSWPAKTEDRRQSC